MSQTPQTPPQPADGSAATAPAPDPRMTTRDMICFALYSASHAMTRFYRPLLDEMGLTYPQFLVLVELWAEDGQSLSRLGEALALESNTLTPLIRRMGEAGLVTKRRDDLDERMVRIHLTDRGRALQGEADRITACVFEATGLDLAELVDLREKVTRLRDRLRDLD